MSFHIIYYPLYMFIMQVYHDFNRMRDFGCLPDSGRKIWLWSYILTPIDVMTQVVSPNSGRASRLRSMSVPHVLPPQQWKTLHCRARWLQHLTTHSLSWKQTRRDAWLNQHLKPQHLTASHVQESGHVPCDQWTLSPTWFERNLSIQKDSVPLQTWADQGLRMSGQATQGSMPRDHGTKNWSHLGKILSSTNWARSRSGSLKALNALWTQCKMLTILGTKQGTTRWKIQTALANWWLGLIRTTTLNVQVQETM
jgi:hypothetical protein